MVEKVVNQYGRQKDIFTAAAIKDYRYVGCVDEQTQNIYIHARPITISSSLLLALLLTLWMVCAFTNTYG